MAHQLKINVCCGLTGSGKTTWLSNRGLWLLRDNEKTSKKYPQLEKRIVASNIKFSPWVEEKYGLAENGGQIYYWSDISDLERLRNADVLWDELAVELDSTQYALTPLSLKRWLQQHRKYGVSIYGTVQDLPMLDIAMRRLVHNVRYARKMAGTRDIAAGMPTPKFIWGVVLLRLLKRECFAKDVSEYQFEGFLSSELIIFDSKSVSAFDTTQEINKGKYPPLRKIVRVCPEDGYTRTIYT
jgi:hypothetical protein